MYSRCTPARRERMAQVLSLLSEHNPARLNRPRSRDPIDVLVLAMLSQNTNMANSRGGFKQLRRAFPTWAAVMNAPVREVQRHIAICGLARMRSYRLLALLKRIKDDNGKLDLQHLRDLAVEEALEYLLSFHGVGPKTAAYTLCFAFDMPVLPVDHGIWRMARRLKLVRAKAPEPETTRALTQLCPGGRHYALHTLLFSHAKTHCRPRNPKCRECPLVEVCPTGKSRLRHRPVERIALPPRRVRERILAGYASAGIPLHGRDDGGAERPPDFAPRTRRPAGLSQRAR